MREVTRIHLAKTVYDIEVDAKKALEVYMHAIERAVHKDADTTREIEIRMVEILAERGVNENGVITSEDVAALKDKLGEARHFSDDEAHEEEDVAEVQSTKRRFMRDESQGWLAGVCAGIAMRIGAKIWMIRALFVVFVLMTHGAGIFAYIVLWMLVPAARTRSDKLSMAGEPATVASIKDMGEQIVQSPFVRFTMLAIKVTIATIAVLLIIAFIGLTAGMTYVLTDIIDVSSIPAGVAMATVAGVGIVAAFVFLVAIIRSLYGTRRKFASMVALAAFIVGITTCLVFFALAVNTTQQMTQAEMNMVQTHKDTRADLKGATELTVKGDGMTEIVYHVTDDTPSVAMNEVTFYRNRAQYEVKRSGNTINMVMQKNNKKCPFTPNDRCPYRAKLDIYGPAVARVTTQNAPLFKYEGSNQPKLEFAFSDVTFMNEIKVGRVNELVIHATNTPRRPDAYYGSSASIIGVKADVVERLTMTGDPFIVTAGDSTINEAIMPEWHCEGQDSAGISTTKRGIVRVGDKVVQERDDTAFVSACKNKTNEQKNTENMKR